MDIEKELDLKSLDRSYINSVTKKYNDFLQYAQLPVPFYNVKQPTSLPSRIHILYDNIFTIIDEQLCYAFDVESYKNTGYLSSLLLDAYFKQAVENNVLVKKVIYVDTNLLLDDYKKLMDLSSDQEISLAHSKETLLVNLETADYVLWDKVSYISSSYDRQKFYNLISTRYRQGLGNMFFIKNSAKAMSQFCDDELLDVMCIDNIIKLEDIQLKSSNKEEESSIKW